MKRTIIKILSLLAVPAIVVGAAACKDDGAANSGYELLDKDEYPSVEAPYEDESRAAIERWLAAENNPLTSAQVAKEVAAELFAYACYNEEYIDKYVYFSDQTGSTDLPAWGSSTVRKQDYKLIINENDETCGYKYHYTIRHVDEISGLISVAKSAFESSALRFVVDTNVLYRFEGGDSEYFEDENQEQKVLTCNWTPKGDAWGVSEDEPPIVKRDGEKLNLEQIEEDIVQTALSDGEAVIHGNINVLADDIISSASIQSMELDGGTVYTITMRTNAEVLNNDEASIAMLQKSNDAEQCRWADNGQGEGPTIIFQIWDNGLFKLYGISENWIGNMSYGPINVKNGEANSRLSVQYSYSDRDTDMTAKLAMLDEAIASRG